MSKSAAQSPPPDKAQREQALDPSRSILVQAPAGSGKTDLLTRRFLRLLAEVEEPGQVMAITFTNAAAAEMRDRILSELEKASATPQIARRESPPEPEFATCPDDFSMESLAHRALRRSEMLDWKLLDLPAQIRISTIDSFCRELALQQPLFSGLGGGLEIAAQPRELYRRAARETLRKIDQTGSALGAAIEELLLWRDNGWQEMENLLVEMLESRDRWMHGFVLDREPDWELLRERLEQPFANAVRLALIELSHLLDRVPGACAEALELARFACSQSGGQLHQQLAELAQFPCAPFAGLDSLEEACQAHAGLSDLLLTGTGSFRKQVDKRLGFPADRKPEKGRILELIAVLAAIPGLEAALAGLRHLPPVHYSEEEWQIVRSCFTLLRQAAGELQIVFAEEGRVDFTEVAQIAQRVLRGEDGLPTDAALAVSDGIRHLLVDEFQDTSRRQHQLLSSLIAAWPERTARTVFAVGDPMQSIYFFRDADAELFPRVKAVGLEIPHDEPLLFDSVSLTANFRTARTLLKRLNFGLEKVFESSDRSGVIFSSASPARNQQQEHCTGFHSPRFKLHLEFVHPEGRGKSAEPETAADSGAAPKNEAARGTKNTARDHQIEEIVALIGRSMDRIQQAKASHEKYRIAILGRARSHLVPIAAALREAGIPFRAVELEKLASGPEVLDALALARALFQSEDRLSWLGVLRAPWCGLSLDDLDALAGQPELLTRPVPELLAERLPLLSEAGRSGAERVLRAVAAAHALRAAQPAASLGTWLEQTWLHLGGAACVDAAARANLSLLWRCLDLLPSGEPALFGPGLDAALDKLTALPDPNASRDCGVQLMTIHKSKGLEFEVVILPELQATGGRGKPRMLSWLERGIARSPAQLADSGEISKPDEITEFLIAPFQSKGANRGKAKEWVDRVYRERESQETRRILYVAATRAREQLHVFARPAYKEEGEEFALVKPLNSLLATAWPALEELVRARFQDWKSAGIARDSHPGQQPDHAFDRRLNLELGQEIESIAASGESHLLTMPTLIQPTLLRRLPSDYQPAPAPASAEPADSGTGSVRRYARHEGGLRSRALGTAVHALLEELARLRAKLDWPAARSALRHFDSRIAAQLCGLGVDPPQAEHMAAQALQHALNASSDPIGSWILSPHLSAVSEAGWTGVVAGQLRTVRTDRVFQAGAEPGSDGDDCWWIIDYKTAHAENIDPALALPEFRALFAPQIEAYAQILTSLRGPGAPVRAGLYYPRMAAFDWWEI
jgi:ATP-dependent exoDNAse (exonuclease V) beta subunit